MRNGSATVQLTEPPPRAVEEPHQPAADDASADNGRPDRYRVKRDTSGGMLTCVEAPTVTVRVRNGVTVTAAGARSAAPGSIFLDGAAQGEPFLDPKREVYNLDHHEGCVRAFTLATCEQAMVLVRTGLDLRKRDWTVYANDADLDTVLAIWILLNHVRLTDESAEIGARVMPLVRLQGTIDAHGLELRDLCALPPALLAETQAWMDELRERELALKAEGVWQDLDLVGHTADRLRTLDRLVYPPKHFDDITEIEELARAEIGTGSVAIVCRSKAGIYEVQRQLSRLHGKRLGVVALQRTPTAYSLRQVDPYLPATLERVYEHLNLVDPAAGGHHSANRWGGSPEIGGSPRATGTRVTPDEVAEACRLALGTPTLLQALSRLAMAFLTSTNLVVAALASVFVLGLLAPEEMAPAELAMHPANQFAVVLTALGGGFYLLRAARAPGLYGLRPPAGVTWWSLLPFALLGAVAGGVWIPTAHLPPVDGRLPGWHEFVGLLALPLASELIFRGVFHGALVTCFPVQRLGGPWFLSWPALFSAALYTLWGAVLQLPAVGLTQGLLWGSNAAVTLLGAMVFGTVSAMARERSESVVASVMFHWICVAVVLVAHLT
jgi:hypothetical protein